MLGRRLGLALALTLGTGAAPAQTLTREVRLIVPVAPGGTIDAVARVMAQSLSPELGRSIVVENRSGGGFFIGLQAVAQAPPDGHTLGIAPLSTMATAPVLPGMQAPIDLDRDLTKVVNLFRVPMLLVARPNAPFRSLPELIAWGRANPDRLTVGQSGNGTTTHLLAARLAQEAGLTMQQVAYRGGTPALADVMAGNVDLYFSLLSESLPQIRAGRMLPIAFTTTEPNPHLPDVPLLTNTYPGFTGAAAYGLVAPAGLPPEWVAFWARTMDRFLRRPDIRERLERTLVLEVTTGTPEAFRQEVDADRVTWGAVIRAAGIRAE